MAEIDLEKKFPDMQPVKSLPSLANIYGCGFGFHGSRDHDEETGSYIRTHCLCLLFFPVFALGAYRVLPTSSGWYVIGRHRLSALAKLFNFVVVAGAITAGSVYGWHKYTHTPNYIATQKLDNADEHVAAGQFVEAAKLYSEVAIGDTEHAETAGLKLEEMVYGPLDKAELDEITPVLEIVIELNQREVLASDMRKLAMRVNQLVRGRVNADPRGVLKAMNVVVPPGEKLTSLGFEKDKDAEFIAEFLQLRENALQQIVADSPDDLDVISQLALLYEARDEVEKCQTLLTPHAKQLGDSEGARVLGQILARQGEFGKSEELLLPYCEQRLEQLHAAEQKMNQLFESAQYRLVDELRKGGGPQELQKRIENARNDDARMAMLQEYVLEQLGKDFDIKRAQAEFSEAARVVPVALDLGIVLLRRGQDMADPAARQASLEKAEKTFLAIQGVAGESDQYRLFLGQVYYWLGKQNEGREQFEQLVAAKGGDFETLVILAGVLREVGEVPQARARAEEAYNGASDSRQKNRAAGLRAVMSIDLDDKITWLKRADQSSIEAKASLNDALAEKSMRDGDNEAAADYLRKAIDAYAGAPKTDAMLNNTALSLFRLFEVTGDRTALSKALKSMDEAVALSPSDSILLINAASFAMPNAFRDLASDKIDYNLLKTTGSLEHLLYLYDDAQSRAKLVERIKAHEGVQRAVSYYERVTTLAPKGYRGYAALAWLHGFTDDQEQLKRLLRRIEEGDPDLSDINSRSLKYYSGELDEEVQADLDAKIKRLREALQETSAKENPVTFALAASELAKDLITKSLFDPELETDEPVDLAEQAHAAAPSAGTRKALISALLHRANHALANQEQTYKQLHDDYRRSLSSSYLICIAMSKEGRLREAVITNPDVIRASKMVVEEVAKYPQRPGVWDWAMTRFTKPELADEIAESVRSTEAQRSLISIDWRLTPLSGRSAYRMFWLKQIENDEAAGMEALRQCAEAGVPLPWKEGTSGNME